jgi:hypothetical protein
LPEENHNRLGALHDLVDFVDRCGSSRRGDAVPDAGSQSFEVGTFEAAP